MAKALSGIDVSFDKLEDTNALLLYKVGPVRVCSPVMPVESITIPPNLNSLLGTSDAEPGVFKSIHGMVRVVDLRVRFGVNDADRKSPGRIIITEVTGGYAGFLVDEIEDVISFPEKGWSQLPPLVPREVFSRAIVNDDGIRLYADLESLDKFKTAGYLRFHIENIKSAEVKRENNELKEQIKETSTKAEEIDEPVSDASSVAFYGKEKIENSLKPIDKPVNKEELKNSLRKNKAFTKSNAPVKIPDSDKRSRKLIDKKTRPINAETTVSKKRENIFNAPIAHSKKIEKHSINQKIVGRDKVTSKVSKNSFHADTAGGFSGRAKKNVTIVEESNNNILWISMSALVFFAISIYLIEFSNILVDDLTDASSVKINNQLLVDKNKTIGLNKNEDKYAIESKIATNYNNDKVDVSSTDEGIVIVINDYEKEEDIDSTHSMNLIGSSDKSKEGAIEETAESQLRDQDDFKELNSDVVGVDIRESHQITEPDFVSEGEGRKAGSLNVVNEEISNKSISGQEIAPETRAIKTIKNVHIVVEGDTLWNIAERYVNDPWKYPELARLSEIKDPDLIYPGQKVVIIYNTNK